MKRIIIICIGLTLSMISKAQDGYFYQGEIGFVTGAAHYFGDLNTRAAFNRPSFSGGIFVRKNFGNYTALRLAATYGHVRYADKYNLKNDWQRGRNLSFESNIIEFSAQGDFNFYKFEPGSDYYRYTPYITLGVGLFTYDPYAWFKNAKTGVFEKTKLRDVGTEGQLSGNPEYASPYTSMAVCVPLGVGMKFSLNRKINLVFEAGYRFTSTDYLDDVSTIYPDDSKAGISKALMLISDRSNEQIYSKRGATAINPSGQRGYSKQNDSYMFVHAGISFNIITFKCPSY